MPFKVIKYLSVWGKKLSLLKKSEWNMGEKCGEAEKCTQIVISRTLGEHP